MTQLLEILEMRSRLVEGQVAVSPEYVQALRRDFLLLMKNTSRLNTADKIEEFRTAVYTFISLVEKIGTMCRSELENVKWRSGHMGSPSAGRDAEYLLGRAKEFWALPHELLPPGASRSFYKSEKYFTDPDSKFVSEFLSRVKTWEARVRRVAPKAWKWIESAAGVVSGDSSGPGAVVVDHGAGELMGIEGFRVRVDGAGGSSMTTKGVQGVAEAFRILRAAAKRRFPGLIANAPAFILNMSGETNMSKGADWKRDEINVYYFGLHDKPLKVAQTFAHELAHGVYQLMLSERGRKAWEDFVRGGKTKIDLREILKTIGDDGWIHAPDEYKDDPVLFLQIAGLGNDPSYRFERGSDIRRWLADGGDPFAVVSSAPISAYAAKNSEEAFCEALARLVVYGPKTVLPEVRQMLRALLPSIREEGRCEDILSLRRSLVEAKRTPRRLEQGATGDCYEVAASRVIFDAKPGDVLVHGRPTLQVPPFVEYGHAWVENGDNVIDLTNGFRGPRGLYYAIGNINWKDCLVYTPEEARKFVVYYGHWGPWEGPDAVRTRTRISRRAEKDFGKEFKLPKRSLSSRSPHSAGVEKALERLSLGMQDTE